MYRKYTVFSVEKHAIVHADDMDAVSKFVDIMGQIYQSIEIVYNPPVYPVEFIDEIILD